VVERIRVALADDQVLFVQSLKKVMESLASDIEVVGIARTGTEAISLIERTTPDVILLDVRMPEMDGVSATKVIHERWPELFIIILTTFDDDEYVYEALQRGAVGYLLKNIPVEELIQSVRAVNNGSVLLSPSIVGKLVDQASRYRTLDGTQPARDVESLPSWFKELSGREREVLKYIAMGYDNAEIAEAMFIAQQTVRNHVSTIYSKIGEHDRIKLMQKVRELYGTR
jgi:DNA-binding NarL/FixJ family response regulator